MYNVNATYIVNNTMEYSSESTMLLAWSCRGIFVMFNNITHSLMSGILFYESRDIFIYRNNISSNNQAIKVEYCQDTVVCNNNVNDNAVGFYYTDNCRTKITGNKFNSNTIHGMNFANFLYEDPELSMFGNEMVGNGESGIYLYNISRTKIVENNISYNYYYGLELENNCTFNYIWSNAFGENNLGTVSDSSLSTAINYWNWTDIGNWYSDYLDKYPGASQSGGRWSEDYVLSPKNIDKDYNPLVDPILISDPEVLYTGVLEFEEGSGAVDISWEIVDMTISCVGIYTILIDHVIYEEGIFLENEGAVWANLGFMTLGEHNVTLIVEDGLGGLTQYEVIIEVTGAGGFVPGYDILILIMIFGCSAFLISQSTRRKIRKSNLESS